MSDRRMTEWFLREKALREWEGAASAPRPPRKPVITLSRQFGAGGHTVASLVAARLGPAWQVWDREIAEAIARRADVEAEMVEALDEHTRLQIDEAVKFLLGVQTLERARYQGCLVRVLLAVAQQGQKIIVGRGANFLLRDALHVRLHAPVEYRVQATMRRESLPREKAQRRVRLVEQERASFIRDLYHRDVDGPEHYDLILQTGRLTMEGAATVIAAAIEAGWPPTSLGGAGDDT